MLVGMAWECFCATGTPGALVFRGVGRAIEGAGTFESLLHRQILKTQTPDFNRESRGFVVFGVQKIAPWDHHGTGALFWCENKL